MRSLIVLCAGSRMADGIPLYLQRHPDGKLIAEKAIEGIYPENYDRIVYSILKETDDDFHAKDLILEELGGKYSVEVVVLPNRTGGPAETAYQTLRIRNIDGEIAFRDSHNYIRIEQDCIGNFIAGLDLTIYEDVIDGLRTKSFITLNEQSQVLDVVEKHFCSDVISVGLYGFKKVSDFMLAYEHLLDPNYGIKKLYLSHIISYLIGYKGRVFHSVRTQFFEDWSTVSAWNRLQKNHSTCFLNLDEVCGNAIPFEESVLSALKLASLKGCVFIGYSKKVELDKTMLIKYLKENNINIQDIVLGCTFSKSRILIDGKEKLNDWMLEG